MQLIIGICDDNAEQVYLLTQYLNDYPCDDVYNVIQSTDPQEFFEMLRTNTPHIVFLDIDMGEINGIELGNKIKALNENAIIVYITAHEKYALDAFRVRAFHYLLKPLTKEKFNQVLTEAVELLEKNMGNKPDNIFTIQTKGEIIRLHYSEICYFEKVGHKIKVHTNNRDICYYDNLLNLLGQLDADSFIQCHQGFIANVDKIRGFKEKTLYLSEGLQLPVSRPYVEPIKEMLAKRLFSGRNSS